MQRAALPVLAGLLLFSGGCSDTCESACEALLACDQLGEAESSQATCELDCAVQQDHWEEKEEATAFDELLGCIGEATCDDLESGLCYDEELYGF